MSHIPLSFVLFHEILNLYTSSLAFRQLTSAFRPWRVQWPKTDENALQYSLAASQNSSRISNLLIASKTIGCCCC